jgi:1,4-alpha-glucan branching enzyme
MQITIWYRSASPRTSVFIHAWDLNGKIWDFPGVLSADGLSFALTLTGTTEDQRDISFKYRFGPVDWESDSWVRTIPTTTATELWTQDFSARCALQAPGPPATFPYVTIHAITEHRFNGGAVFAWVPSAAGSLFYQSLRDDANNTSSFTVPLTPALQLGFYFKLVGASGQPPFSDFEDEPLIRFWQPSDGPEIWVKSGQLNVQSQTIVPLQVYVDLFFPSLLGTPGLRIQDLLGDFSDTLIGTPPAAIDATFASSRFTVSVYTGISYNIWWSTEPQHLARNFRISDPALVSSSIAVNGYDHWLNAPPVTNGQIDLIIHPNPVSTFGATITVDVGIGDAPAHQTITATRTPDGAAWFAQVETFLGVPFWATLVGESRPDGPLDFRRGFMSKPATPLLLHTIDGVGGVSSDAPVSFAEVSPVLRQTLMKTVYGDAIVNACVFDPWEMPHGVNKLNGHAYFVVRAPHAVHCSLLLMPIANAVGVPRVVTEIPMNLTNDLRYWWTAVPAEQAPDGVLYRFAYSDGKELLAPDAKLGETLDPASRMVLDAGSLTVDAGSGAEQSWSCVADLDVLAAPLSTDPWKTAGWNWLNIYELHAQCFTQRNEAAATCFDQVIDELRSGYLSRLPITALEFLPVHEFPASQAGWGYNPALFFAIDSSYGGPTAFARLVRSAHDATRGILLDLVYNHLVGSPMQALARDVYVSGETAWGDMVHFAHPAACEFFRQATVYLWKVLRLDGFRFDSTETIINGDHYVDSTPYVIARDRSGTYKFGAGKGWEFLGILKTALRRAADAEGMGWPYLVGENDPENVPMTDPDRGVLDGQWHFSQMYALNNAARSSDDHASDVRNNLDNAGTPFQRSVIYGESHDSASGRDGRTRIAATPPWGLGRQMSKAVGALVLLAKGIPMIFMGQEAGETQPFTFGLTPADPGFTLSLNSYEVLESANLQVLTWFRDLMGLRNNPANNLGGNGSQTSGLGYKTVAFTRAGGEFFIIVTFGTNTQQQNLAWLGLPMNATYKEVFNSTWERYAIQDEPLIQNGGYGAQLHSGDLINLPGTGAIVLQRC